MFLVIGSLWWFRFCLLKNFYKFPLQQQYVGQSNRYCEKAPLTTTSETLDTPPYPHPKPVKVMRGYKKMQKKTDVYYRFRLSSLSKFAIFHVKNFLYLNECIENFTRLSRSLKTAFLSYQRGCAYHMVKFVSREGVT